MPGEERRMINFDELCGSDHALLASVRARCERTSAHFDDKDRAMRAESHQKCAELPQRLHIRSAPWMDKRDAEAVVLEMRRNKQDHVVVNEGARVTHAKGQLLDQRRPRIGRGIVDLDGARIAQLLCPVLTDRAADEVELSTDREELTREARFAGASDLLELLRGKIEEIGR